MSLLAVNSLSARLFLRQQQPTLVTLAPAVLGLNNDGKPCFSSSQNKLSETNCGFQFSFCGVRSFHTTAPQLQAANAAESKATDDNVVPITWTTHRLTKEQIAKVDSVFHRLLWLDMFEIQLLDKYVNERLGRKFTPQQRKAVVKFVESFDLDGQSDDTDGSSEEKAEPEAAAPKSVDIRLVGFDEKSKIKVIKEVRSIAGLGLKEAKELVESAPKVIVKGIKPEQAKELQEKLLAAGAKIELQEV